MMDPADDRVAIACRTCRLGNPDCDTCGGSGEEFVAADALIDVECSACDGDGCPDCDDDGVVELLAWTAAL